jgi:DNA polymerase-3 subunit delta'
MIYNWKTVGHYRQKREIEKNIEDNKLFHAYLFAGPKHIGKFQFALEIAKTLFCPHNLCNECETCKKIDKLTHPDLIVVDKLYQENYLTDLEEISKHTNISQKHREKIKTDSISISDIKVIQKSLQNKSLSKYKICLIRNIDRLTIEATNAFLKTVEEPNKNTIFIFTTAKENLILETLLSRLRIIRFNLLSDKLIKENLTENKNKEKIINFAQGRIKIAQKLSKDEELFSSLEKNYQQIVNFYYYNDYQKNLEFLNKIKDNPKLLQRFFEYSFFYLRSLLNKKNKSEIIKTIKNLQKAETYLSKNINKTLVLENFLLDLKPLN